MFSRNLRRGAWAIDRPIACTIACLVPLLLAAAASGQATFAEDFEGLGGDCVEGPCRLEAEGWIFRKHADPPSEVYPAWEVGTNPPSHSGGSHMRSEEWDFYQGDTATWALLPQIPRLAGGDVMSFHFLINGSPHTALEVRYSPSGGTDTGISPFDTGDFTELLLSVGEDDDGAYGVWVPASATIPGPPGPAEGRIAFRFHEFPQVAGNADIDTLAFNVAPATPPLPDSGETVTWTLAMSPIVIDEYAQIPAGGTVMLEPGVELIVEGDDLRLDVQGTLIAHGTPEQPITITAPQIYYPHARIEARESGTIDLRHCIITGTIEANGMSAFDGQAGVSILAEDCHFISGRIITQDLYATNPQFVSINNCQFTGEGPGQGVTALDSQVLVRNSTFTDGNRISVLRGYPYLDNVTIDGAALAIHKEDDQPQPIHLDRITVTNSPGGGLDLAGWDYFLGPDVVLQSNLYPLQLEGGLLPGSTVPSTGNTNNYIHVRGEFFSGAHTWARFDIPYVLDPPDQIVGASGKRIDPGVVVQGMPGAHLQILWPVHAQGLPDEPIVFQPFAGQWGGIISLDTPTATKIDDCIVEGAAIGVSNGDLLWIENSLIRDCDIGSNTFTAFSATYIAKSKFLDNDLGIRATPDGVFDAHSETNPNWIEGNGQGAIEESGQSFAQNCWWGDPSGPMHPDNPGGQGDSANTFVEVLPFLTVPPDFDDHPPVVRIQRQYVLYFGKEVEVGERFIIEWDASDDGEIVSQTLLYSEHSGYSPFIPIVEDMPPDQRSVVVTMPVQEPGSLNNPAMFRVVATDDAGQEGMDHIQFWVDPPTAPEFPDAMGPGPFPAGASIDAYIDEEYQYPLYAVELGESGVVMLAQDKLPLVSSDLVRLLLAGDEGPEDIHYSNWFTVRPDDRFDDEPPQITLSSPGGGSFPGGSIVPIAWTASDDEALRSFTIQATYNGGERWVFIAEDLPPETTSFDWRLPPIEEPMENVQVRVIAFDLRFQVSSDTTVPLTLTAGDGSPPADLDGDGSVGFSDLLIVLAAWGDCPTPPAECGADIDESGDVGFNDLLILLAAWSG